ncbi:MAG: PAS domain S-box protein [Ignavibacteria bacterium]|nr:PAS domain S-box protein [Ignavibacteria bacterium]
MESPGNSHITPIAQEQLVKQLHDEIDKLHNQLSEQNLLLKQTETQLLTLYKLFNSGNDAIVFLDLKGCITHINAIAALRFQRKPADLIGLDCSSLFPPNIAQKYMEKLGDCIKNKIIVTLDEAMNNELVRTTFFPIEDGHGEITGICIRGQLLTEFRKYETIISTLAECFSLNGKAFFEAAVNSLTRVFDVRFAMIGKLSETDQNTVSVFAASENGTQIPPFSYNLQGTPCATVIDQKPRIYRDKITELFPSDEFLLNTNARSYIGYPLFSPDGKAIGLILLIDTKPLEETRTIELLLELLSKRVVAEVQIEADRLAIEGKANQFGTLYQAAPIPIAISRNGRYLLVNMAFAQMFGYSSVNECIGNSLSNFVAESVRKDIIARNGLREAGDSVLSSYECLGLRKNGEEFSFHANLALIQLDDGSATLGYFRDLTQEKEAQKEIEAKEFWLKESQVVAGIGSYIFYIQQDKWESTSTLDDIFGIDETDPHNVESWLSLIIPEDRTMMEHYFLKDVIHDKKIFDKDYRVLNKKTNLIRWVHGKGQLQINSEGLPVTMMGTIQDITYKKFNEKSLLESERRFRTVLENIRLLSLMLDDEGNIIFINDFCLEVTGYKRDELLYKNLSILLTSDSITGSTFLANIRSGAISTAPEPVYIRTKHSERRLINWTYLVLRDISGIASGIVCIGDDITEEYKAKEQLQSNQKMLSTLMNNLPGVVYRCKVDEARTMLFLSEGCKNLTGYLPSSILLNSSISFMSIVVPEDRENLYEVIGAAVYTKDSFTVEYRLQNADGMVRWVSETGQCITDSTGNFLYLEGFITDITDRKIYELALEESERKYKQFVDDDISGDFISTPEGMILFCNKTFANIFGYDNTEEITFHNFWQLLYDGSEKHTILERLRSFGKIEKEVLNLRHKDGTLIPSLANAIAETRESGDIFRIHGYILDLTEQKRAERALELNQERLNSLHQLSMSTFQNEKDIIEFALQEIIRLTSSKGGYLAFVSNDQNTLQLCAWTDHSIGRKIIDIPAFARADEAGIWTDCIKQNGPIIHNSTDVIEFSSEEHTFSAMVNRHISISVKDRGTHVLLAGVFNKHYDYHSEDARELQIFMNEAWKIITEKRDEDELMKLYLALHQSPVSVCITDMNGDITYVNRKFTEVSGYNEEELMGQNPRILKSGETPTNEYGNLWNTIQSGKDWIGEFHNRKKNGELFWESAVISPVKNQFNEISSFIAIKEDITERKQMMQDLLQAKERAEQMNIAKSSFFANMSHELRTPLIGIMGFSELLQAKLDNDPDSWNMADIINTSGRRLLETLNLILSFSKLEADKITPQLREHNLVQIISEIFRLYVPVAKKKSLECDLEILDDELICKTDGQMLRSILNNLLNNAIKFTEQGKVGIKVWRQHSLAYISVFDTGPGIPEEKQSVIWQEFRQVSEGIGRSFEGTGLGLTIARRYAEILNSTITLSSKPGEGAAFTLAIPLLEKDAEPIHKLEILLDTDGQPLTHGSGIQKNILYVEDDGVSRDFVKRLLGQQYKLDFAPDALTALQLVEKRVYDLLLMDINLGKGMDGVQLTRLIREKTEYTRVPIIAITAFAMEEDRTEFLSSGMDDYISKPFTAKDLRHIIEKSFSPEIIK